MNEQNNGGPAFPLSFKWDEPQFNGMTLRDYFAAKALQGLLACADSDDFEDQKLLRNDYDAYCLNFATSAYQMADAMLKARG